MVPAPTALAPRRGVGQCEIRFLAVGRLGDLQFHSAQLGNCTIPVGFKHLKDSNRDTAAVP